MGLEDPLQHRNNRTRTSLICSIPNYNCSTSNLKKLIEWINLMWIIIVPSLFPHCPISKILWSRSSYEKCLEAAGITCLCQWRLVSDHAWNKNNTNAELPLLKQAKNEGKATHFRHTKLIIKNKATSNNMNAVGASSNIVKPNKTVCGCWRH